MNKKIGLVVALAVVILAGAAFIMMRRSHMRGMMENVTIGNLHAVTANGTSISVPASQLPENTAAQESDGLVVIFALNPYPPTMTGTSTFDVTLTDPSGQPVSGAAITLDMTMPGMWMPTNQPVLTEGEGGHYSGPGQFTMRGLWRIEVIITRDGKTQSVFFDLGL